MKHIERDFTLKAWVQSPGWTLRVRQRLEINFFRIKSCCISNYDAKLEWTQSNA